MALPPESTIRWRAACRLIPSRYPSAGMFDAVASPDDLEAIVELEAWTNDRLSVQLGVLNTIPRDEWLVGEPMASVVMAAFCHPSPDGARFSGPDRGAWYAARRLETAIVESVHRRTLELQEVGHFDTRMQMRLYHADFTGSFHDLRGLRQSYPAVYALDSYAASQRLARQLLDQGSAGILYDSVRHDGGECIACFRPRLVTRVRIAAHYEYVWDGTPQPRVRRLSGNS